MIMLCDNLVGHYINTGTMIWTGFAALAAAISALFAWKQLSKSNKIVSGTFSQQLKNDFFNKETNCILVLFQYSLLEYKVYFDNITNIKFECFELIQERLDKNPQLKESIDCKKRYSSYEIDNLLNNFEDLGIYYEKGLIDLEFIYEGFSFYMDLLYHDTEIQKYIGNQRLRDKDKDIYDKFFLLYKKVEDFSNKKLK